MKYRVRHGGLMRCCLQTLDEHMASVSEPPKPGELLKCRWCHGDGMIVSDDGAWEWNRTAESWKQ